MIRINNISQKYQVKGEYLSCKEIARKYNFKENTVRRRIQAGYRGQGLICSRKELKKQHRFPTTKKKIGEKEIKEQYRFQEFRECANVKVGDKLANGKVIQCTKFFVVVQKKHYKECYSYHETWKGKED